MSATFYLFVSGDYNCGVEGFWPDGDAPENATDEDAAKVVREYIEANGISRFMSDWSLEHDLQVSVGAYLAWPVTP